MISFLPTGHFQTVTYLLTFNCYGTHLPGDEEGFVDRARGNHRGGYCDASPSLAAHARQLMKQPSFQLDVPQAMVVLEAIREVCLFRGWDLLAAHVRTMHVHAVADRIQDPNRTLADFKAYASSALNRQGHGSCGPKRWAREGSTRSLGTEAAVHAAIRYVADRQGHPMAVYALGKNTSQ